ncbi:MAG: S8 family serine peptidase [Phycisphaerae bacterium]|nr:S8 family serine peptidase [Phycisphaerae bacterium]MCZ2398955.1 S8 family serine peptidase [Phycisphaerae bacterium]NUQ50575.1 S8 family serine peptidase [Phycisphaerae bacterium]
MSRSMAALASALAAVCVAHAGTLDGDLERTMREAGENEAVSTLVFLADRVDLGALKTELRAARVSLAERHRRVLTELQQRSAIAQPALLAHLAQLKQQGLAEYEAFWLANCVRVDARPEVIRAIAARADVEHVFLNYRIELIEPVAAPPTPAAQKTPAYQQLSIPEPGLLAIRAPLVWSELGFSGEGVLVASLDSGVDGSHPALASRWAGVADPRYAGHPEWAWWDGIGQNPNFPYDALGHGTHTMGTITGGPPGDSVGVAPKALWISSTPNWQGQIGEFVSDAILIYQWMVNPDGDLDTHWDVPACCCNSWGLVTGHGYPPCDQLLWEYLDACETAGVAILFAAGNEGAQGLRRPSDRATTDYDTCAVAAVDANTPGWPIASFSSRGPTNCTPTGDPFIKPNIAAPGVQVRSSIPGGGYGPNSGTSMATPHITGVVALMRQACPNMEIDVIKQIMYETAVDLGDPGKDNSYGWGMVDAYAAVKRALELCAAPCPGDLDGDGDVDQSDLGILLADFGCAADCAGDLDGDGDVDQGDLGILLANYGQSCD